MSAAAEIPNPSPASDAFEPLDGVPLAAAWKREVALSILDLAQGLSKVDLRILSRVASYLAVHRAELEHWASIPSHNKLHVPDGAQEATPVGTTLLLRRQGPARTRSLDLLLAVLVESSLEADGPSGRVKIAPLGQALRGALPKENSNLHVLLGEVESSSTIPDLCAAVERHLDVHGETLHTSFLRYWKSRLRYRIGRWIGNAHEGLARAYEPKELIQGLDGQTATVMTAAATDPDDGLEISAGTVETTESNGQPASTEGLAPRASARALLRLGEGDLFAPPESFAPDRLVAQIAQAAVTQAAQLQSVGRPANSLALAGLAFAIATGMREGDFEDVRWTGHPYSEGDDPAKYQLDRTSPFLHCLVSRAPSAYRPTAEMQPHLIPSKEFLPWPIPPAVHRLLLGLTEDGQPRDGAAVFPDWRTRASLRDVVKTLSSEKLLGAGLFRRCLAAHLSARLGPDVAQLAMSDSFSTSVAATYYSAPAILQINTVMRDLHTVWFGEAAPTNTQMEAGHIGSRLVLASEAATLWPQLLRKNLRSTVHKKKASILEVWVVHRNLLVAALVAATGHRPTDAIGSIFLDDVIADHALIILRDKQIDPLRKERVAATGRRWLAELRDYLDRLAEISVQTVEPEAAQHATRILRSEAPLFSAWSPQGPVNMSAKELRSSMPEAMRSSDNHYRHRLNQELQARGIDPELRHAQLGWVLSSTFATADMSPLGACDIATELGGVIDEILLKDGWFGKSQRLGPWQWRDVPLRALSDWATIAKSHEGDAKKEADRLRMELRERGKKAEEAMRPRLAAAIRTFFPSLRLDDKLRRLVVAPGNPKSVRVEISSDQIGLILDSIRHRDERPGEAFEAYTLRVMLHRLLRQSHRAGVTAGALTRRTYLTATADPSPFLPGSGLAVRHTDVLRAIVLEEMRRRRGHSRSILAVLAVLLWSPYRRLDWAIAAVNAAPKALRGQTNPDRLRVPASVDGELLPMVFSGVPALALAQRAENAPTGRAPNPMAIGAWLLQHLPISLHPAEDADILEWVVETARAAGRLELSGPERMLMLGQVKQGLVAAERCLSWEDDWPERTAVAEKGGAIAIPTAVCEPGKTLPPKANVQSIVSDYRRLTGLLNPKLLPRILGKRGDDHRGWRGALESELDKLRERSGAASTLGYLIGFVLHRLRHGGAQKAHLKHGGLHSIVTKFGRGLVAIAGTLDLSRMTSEQFQEVYLAVVLAKPSDESRPPAVEALRAFHRYLEEAHQFGSISFEEIASLAGTRTRHAEPGLVTDAEVHAIFDVLLADIEEERARLDASPDLVRVTELRLVAFALLEASGARPGSVHGLLLTDLYFLGEGQDYTHLHRTGGYGVAKTDTSLGFVPLEGALWSRARSWVTCWLDEEHQRIADTSRANVPLFAHKAGDPMRFADTMLFARISQLTRWATSENSARTYWLRKRRVAIRHAEVSRSVLRPRARDVRRVMKWNGHAEFTVPLGHYICDGAVSMVHSLIEARETARGEILAAVNVDAKTLDLAWSRMKKGGLGARLAEVLDRIPKVPIVPPERQGTTPPPLRRTSGLLPINIHEYACALRSTGDASLAAIAAGLSPEQCVSLNRGAEELLVRRGQVPWCIDGLRHPRAVMKVPRNMKGSGALLGSLNSVPSPAMEKLASIWAERGHAPRLIEEDALLITSQEELSQVREALEVFGIRPDQIDTLRSIPVMEVRVHRGKGNDDRRRSVMPILGWVASLIWLRGRTLNPLRAA